MGCGWAQLLLKDLQLNQEINLSMHGNHFLFIFYQKIQGGNLIEKTSIKDEDIHAYRGSLWGKMNKMGSKIKSELKIQIKNITNVRANVTLISDLECLPKTILLPKSSLSWVKAYRTYLGVRSIKNGVLYKTLSNEISVRAMMKTYNLALTQRAISDSWTKKIT
jgi:hypothetical protein